MKSKTGFQKGHKNGMYGKHHSEETKRKIREANKGRKPYEMTEEIKRKMSESLKGRKHSKETKRKMSLASKGKPKTYELGNGVALCESCHKLTDNYKGKSNKKYE